MKKITSLILVLSIICALCSCNVTEAPQPSVDEIKNVKIDSDFARTNCAYSGFMWKYMSEQCEISGSYPVAVIKSYQQLCDFKKKAKFFHLFEYDYDGLPDLNLLLQGVDEGYFNDKALALVYIVDTSGSVRHKLSDAYIKNGCFYATVESNLPGGAGTDDMAAWFGVLNINAEDIKDATTYCILGEENSKPEIIFDIPTYPGGTKDPVRVNISLGEEFVFDNEDSLYLHKLCEELEYTADNVTDDEDFKYLVKLYSGTVLYGINIEKGYIRRLDCDKEITELSQANLTEDELSHLKAVMSRLKGNL